MSGPIYKGCGRRLPTALVGLLLLASPAFAQARAGGAAQAPPASDANVRKDSLGRDTPRGALLGFIRASRDANDEIAAQYLNTPLKGKAAADLARQLFTVLDRRLPVRLNEVSDDPEGSRANPLRPDQDVVGTISTADGPLQLVVERVNRGALPVWLFSRRTLDVIPAVYDENDLISFDNYLPGFIRTPRIAGIRLFEWLALLLVVPLLYRVLGFARLLPAARLLILAIVIRWLVAYVDLPLRERVMWTTASVLFVMMAAVWGMLRLNAYGERYVLEHFQNSRFVEMASLVRLARRFADVLVVVAGALVGLSYFGVDPTAALAGLGIGGIAVALAAQKTLENVIGGLSLIFDKAVRIGDMLKVGDVSGTVDSIGLRSTRIRTMDRTMLSIPNGQVANVSLETLSARDMCWFHHMLGLRYETTAAQIRGVMEGIRKRLAANAHVESTSLRVRLIRFGPSSLDIEIFAYVLTSDWARFLEIQEELLVGVMDAVESAGAVIALPTQTLHIAAPRAGGQTVGTRRPLEPTGIVQSTAHRIR
jgi:MscS family membrane protein